MSSVSPPLPVLPEMRNPVTVSNWTRLPWWPPSRLEGPMMLL
jgi:hypothetical protein